MKTPREVTRPTADIRSISLPASRHQLARTLLVRLRLSVPAERPVGVAALHVEAGLARVAADKLRQVLHGERVLAKRSVRRGATPPGPRVLGGNLEGLREVGHGL